MWLFVTIVSASPWDLQNSRAEYPVYSLYLVYIYMLYIVSASPWDWQNSRVEYPVYSLYLVYIYVIILFQLLPGIGRIQGQSIQFIVYTLYIYILYIISASPWDWQNSRAEYPVFQTYQTSSSYTRYMTISKGSVREKLRGID